MKIKRRHGLWHLTHKDKVIKSRKLWRLLWKAWKRRGKDEPNTKGQ